MPLLPLELNVPDHSQELQTIEENIDKRSFELEFITKNNLMDDYHHTALYEATFKELISLGHLSQPIFNLQDSIEEVYTKQYLHDTKTLKPHQVKRLWYSHYESLHKPYTILKNRCWRLLNQIDAQFFLTFPDLFPPNWDTRLYNSSVFFNEPFDDVDIEDINDDLDDDRFCNAVDNDDMKELLIKYKNTDNIISIKRSKTKHNYRIPIKKAKYSSGLKKLDELFYNADPPTDINLNLDID